MNCVEKKQKVLFKKLGQRFWNWKFMNVLLNITILSVGPRFEIGATFVKVIFFWKSHEEFHNIEKIQLWPIGHRVCCPYDILR